MLLARLGFVFGLVHGFAPAFAPAAGLRDARPRRAAEVSADVASLKAAVLRGVSLAARDRSAVPAVIALIAQLEAVNPTRSPVDDAKLNGTWALIGTYSVDGPVARSRSTLQTLSDSVYEGLYKNTQWSWLAGGMTSAESSGSKARSFQNIDVARGEIFNIVEFASFGRRARITVTGTIARESPTSLAVVFVASSIEGLPFAPPVVRVPLPRPRGYVETTFLDDEMRISRGSRGTLFVTVRARQ